MLELITPVAPVIILMSQSLGPLDERARWQIAVIVRTRSGWTCPHPTHSPCPASTSPRNAHTAPHPAQASFLGGETRTGWWLWLSHIPLSFLTGTIGTMKLPVLRAQLSVWHTVGSGHVSAFIHSTNIY